MRSGGSTRRQRSKTRSGSSRVRRVEPVVFNRAVVEVRESIVSPLILNPERVKREPGQVVTVRGCPICLLPLPPESVEAHLAGYHETGDMVLVVKRLLSPRSVPGVLAHLKKPVLARVVSIFCSTGFLQVPKG